MTNKIIELQNIKVNITNINDSDYICISDFTKFKEENLHQMMLSEIG